MDPTQNTNKTSLPNALPAPAAGRAGDDSTSPHTKPKRRFFTAAYKLSILEKLDAATERGATGVILR